MQTCCTTCPFMAIHRAFVAHILVVRQNPIWVVSSTFCCNKSCSETWWSRSAFLSRHLEKSRVHSMEENPIPLRCSLSRNSASRLNSSSIRISATSILHTTIAVDIVFEYFPLYTRSALSSSANLLFRVPIHGVSLPVLWTNIYNINV